MIMSVAASLCRCCGGDNHRAEFNAARQDAATATGGDGVIVILPGGNDAGGR